MLEGVARDVQFDRLMVPNSVRVTDILVVTFGTDKREIQENGKWRTSQVLVMVGIVSVKIVGGVKSVVLASTEIEFDRIETDDDQIG